MMKRLMEFCKNYDLHISMTYDYDLRGYTLRAQKYNSFYSVNCSDEEIQNHLDEIVTNFMARVIEEFKLNTVEAILERAKVMYMDDPITRTRTVISQNVQAPLTDDEKEMMKRMWQNQGVQRNTIFKEVSND